MPAEPIVIDPGSLNKLSEVIQDTASSEMFAKGKAILGDENLLGVLNRTVNPITANNQEKEKDQNLWSIYSENINENYENYITETRVLGSDDNIQTIKYIRDAITARHNFFKGTSQSLECGSNINKVMEKFKSEELKSFNQLKSIFNGLKESNNIALEYNNSMNVLKSGKKNELKGITSKIETYKQNLHIDGRKNDYSSKNLDFYKSIHFYVLILYFFLLGLYFIYSDFYSSEKYKNKYYLIALILYIIFPFLLPYILFYIHYAYDYYLEYYNLKEDVVSYPDIVNK
tara:strand:+ start:41 stop:901 length:861 start_codon:yes stop_codon:yes gene_type:complete